MTNVNSTPEAAYVRTLKWDYDGTHAYTCRNVPESVKDKLKEIFEKWGIGYYTDKFNCKGSSVNVVVFQRQWARVQFTIEKPPVKTENA